MLRARIYARSDEMDAAKFRKCKRCADRRPVEIASLKIRELSRGSPRASMRHYEMFGSQRTPASGISRSIPIRAPEPDAAEDAGRGARCAA
jgi:hypothetical protein